MGKRFFITCDEATAICDKNQYNEASLYDKIRLNFHLFRCKYCSKYTKQNSLMTRILGKHTSPCQEKKMPEAEKLDLEKRLEKELSK